MQLFVRAQAEQFFVLRPLSLRMWADSFSQLQKANDRAAIDRIFKELDTDKSNSVDFGEFVKMVCCLTQMCHEYFVSKK